MVKIDEKNKWKPVDLDSAVFSGGVEGLVGIEECTDYDFATILSSKKRKKDIDLDDEELELATEHKNEKKSKNESHITTIKDDKSKAKKKRRRNKKKQQQHKEQNEDPDETEDQEENENQEESKTKKRGKFENHNNHKDGKKLNATEKSDWFTPSVCGGTGFNSLSLKEDLLEEDESNVAALEFGNLQAWTFVPLPDSLMQGLGAQGFHEPTEIQALTLVPAILGRKDIMGAAETGSGKTLAFGLPILTGILEEKAAASQKESAQCQTSANADDAVNYEVEGDSEVDSEAEGDSEADGDSENDDNSENDDSSENDSDVENDDSDIENKASSEEDDEASEEDDEESEVDRQNSDEETDLSDFENLDEPGIGCVRSINNVKMPTNNKYSDKPLYALILTPTRELAVQIRNHLIAAAKFTDIKVAVIVGGMAAVKQERVLSKGPEIVVATPGRLWELIEQGNPHLSKIDDIRYLAIDETDRMVERGHFQELYPLLERLNMNPEKMKKRQNFVFSATLTLIHELPRHLLTKKKLNIKRRVADMTPVQKLQKLVEILGITDPKVVDVTKGKGTSGTLMECRITCAFDEKDYYVYYFLQKHPGRTLIFCNSIGCVKRLTTLLSILGCSPLPLHASMQQRQRLRNLDRFRDKDNSILVATDVAARGLDIPCVEHVLHYQTPRTSESYVHRSGRTARATRQGITVLLVEPSELQSYLRLCRTLSKSEDIPLFPVHDTMLNAVKERVNLARRLDHLELQVRKANSETGWLQKAADEMDMILDDRAAKYDSRESKLLKRQADVIRKQLAQLVVKPVFPRGFSGKYPLSLGNGDILIPNDDKTEKAVDVMKVALENYAKIGKPLKSKRKSLFKPKVKASGDVKFGRSFGKGNKEGKHRERNGKGRKTGGKKRR